MKVIDATGLVLGRLASYSAKQALNGEDVIILNAEKAVIIGSKKAILSRYTFKRDVGTKRKGPFFPRRPDRIVKRTIRGMLSYQQPRGRAAFKKVKAHVGVPNEFKNVTAETVEAAKMKNTPLYMTVGELSRQLGATF